MVSESVLLQMAYWSAAVVEAEGNLPMACADVVPKSLPQERHCSATGHLSPRFVASASNRRHFQSSVHFFTEYLLTAVALTANREAKILAFVVAPGFVLVHFYGEHSSMWVKDTDLMPLDMDDHGKIHDLKAWGREHHKSATSPTRS